VTTKYKWDGKALRESGAAAKKELYPETKVAFEKGTSKATINVTVDEIKRYSVGARKGQTMIVSVSSADASVSLLKGEADTTEGTNSFTAKLTKSGNFVIQVQNNTEKPSDVTLTIEIK
jgi:hypothetical protein